MTLIRGNRKAMSIVFIVTEGVSKQRNQPRVIRNRQAGNEKRVSGGHRPLPCPEKERAERVSRARSPGASPTARSRLSERWAAAFWGKGL